MDEFNRENQNNENGDKEDNMRNQNNGWNESNQGGQDNQWNQNDQTNQSSTSENKGNDYTFWAESAQPAYQAATYSFKKEDLIDENRNDYSYGGGDNHTGGSYNNGNYNTGNYSNGNYSANNYQNTAYGTNYNMPGGKQPKRKDTPAKKFGRLVASAMVFGLIAGIVFQGVNFASGKLFPQQAAVSSSAAGSAEEKVIPATTVSEGVIASSTDLTELVENTMPSIVSITSTVNQEISFFGQTFTQPEDGSGSGIIVGKSDKELLVVTNNHVVEGATAIAVTFINDQTCEATIKGTDTTADLAVVAVDLSKIDSKTLETIKIATLGDSDNVKVGQMAIAIGNALGSGQSVTVGYISAKNRQVNTDGQSKGSQLELLQTDAAINPGNSGGALLNTNGEVIGINDMKYADTNVEGMGYAIPISEAIPIINELMNREILADDEKGYLGITGSTISEENNFYNMPLGVYVYDVASGGAAEEGGVRKGDIIVKINDKKVATIDAVKETVSSKRAGTEITIQVMRNQDGEYKEVELTITLKDASSVKGFSDSQENKQTGPKFGYQQQNPQDQNGQESQNGQNNQDGQNNQNEGNGQDGQNNQNGQGNSQDDMQQFLEDFMNQFN